MQNIIFRKYNRYAIVASLVQLVEHWSPKPNAEGSIPSRRVKKNNLEEYVNYFKKTYPLLNLKN